MNRLIIALLGSVLYSGASMAQKQTYFTNPVIHGDVADPSILRIDDTYYVNGDGVMVKNSWIQLTEDTSQKKSGWYYVDAKGKMIKDKK